MRACRELGATLVAFSPLARGFLTGNLNDVSSLHAKDIRRGMPRFAADAYGQNLLLLGAYQRLAREAGCTPSQLALAWLLHTAPYVVAVPGTTSEAHVRENAAAGAVRLTPDVMSALEQTINQDNVVGARYNASTQAEIDTEMFANETAN